MSSTDPTEVGRDVGKDAEGSGEGDVDSPVSALEPADPRRPDHEARRQTRIADPQTFDVRDLPKPLVECGCGECSDSADPLYGGTRFSALPNRYALNECADPQPMTVERAGEVFRAYMTAAVRDDSRGPYPLAGVEQRYANLMEADRRMVERFGDDVTTVLISRRLSPLAADGAEWLAPLTVDARLHDEGAMKAIRRAVNRDLDGHEFEWIRVTATTDGCATPHEHRLIWVNDPDDEIQSTDFKNVIDLHVDYTAGGTHDTHPVVDGQSDAVAVKTDAEYADAPDTASVLRQSETGGERRCAANTTVATYLGSQLPYWPLRSALGDARDGGDARGEVDDAAWEGGAVRWASGRQWLGGSSGIERLTE